jgi:hypothetical protein
MAFRRVVGVCFRLRVVETGLVAVETLEFASKVRVLWVQGVRIDAYHIGVQIEHSCIVGHKK